MFQQRGCLLGYPDGRSMIFLDGIVKGRCRNSYTEEELLEPGKVVQWDIDLGYIAIVLSSGHRLRVAISSSNFDRWDINPNTGEPYGTHALTQSLLAERLRVESFQEEPEYSDSLVATNTLFMDANRPSYVLLPIPVEKPGAPTVRQVSWPAASDPLAGTTREDNGRVTTIKNLSYGANEDDRSHLLDLYLPEPLGERASVLFGIHGGGLAIGSKEMFRANATELVKRGYAVATVSYRLKPQHYLPDQVYDQHDSCAATLGWTEVHSVKCGGVCTTIRRLGPSSSAQWWVSHLDPARLGPRCDSGRR